MTRFRFRGESSDLFIPPTVARASMQTLRRGVHQGGYRQGAVAATSSDERRQKTNSGRVTEADCRPFSGQAATGF